MTLVLASTGTTNEAVVYTSGTSTYVPYSYPADEIVFEVSARDPEPPADLLRKIRSMIERLDFLRDGPDSPIVAGYRQLGEDEEYRSVRRAARVSGAARAARNAQDD